MVHIFGSWTYSAWQSQAQVSQPPSLFSSWWITESAVEQKFPPQGLAESLPDKDIVRNLEEEIKHQLTADTSSTLCLHLITQMSVFLPERPERTRIIAFFPLCPNWRTWWGGGLISLLKPPRRPWAVENRSGSFQFFCSWSSQLDRGETLVLFLSHTLS